MRAKHARKRKFSLGLFVFLLVVCVIVAAAALLFRFDVIRIPDGFATATTTTTVPTTTATTTVATTTTTAVTTTTTVPTYATAANGDVRFTDTLFIGDSRTVGLSLYGKVSDADFFAANTMSSFNVLTTKVDVSTIGNVTLEQLLKQKTYTTVYVMFGINEIGSSVDAIVSKYETLLSKLKTAQPNATIVLQSTFHVREDKQNEKNGLTNEKINTLNTRLTTLADNASVVYLNVNPLFDNAAGAMDTQYSHDGIHCYAKYYSLWRDYLMKQPRS